MPRRKTPVVARLSATNVPWPLDWPALYPALPADAPNIVEIGFGYGHFLRWLSYSRPDARVLGIEIDSLSLQKAEAALDRGEMPNVRVMFARAETALWHVFAPASLDEIHVNFPDPWFKAGHAHRRLIQRDTLDLITSRLKPGGLFTLATDIRDYAEMSAAHLAQTPGLSNTFAPEPWVTQRPIGVMTKYEARGYREGRGGHYFVYRRNDTPAPDLPVIRDLPMPHIKLKDLPLAADIAARFAPFRAHAEGDIHVSYMAAYAKADAVLVEAYVVEPSIHQHVGLLALQSQPSGEWVLSLGAIGTTRPTDGVHYAVRKLAEWLLTLASGAVITGDYTRSHFRDAAAPADEPQA
jgi:tRNA (guanine-N7-)-methyltransferase